MYKLCVILSFEQKNCFVLVWFIVSYFHAVCVLNYNWMKAFFLYTYNHGLRDYKNNICIIIIIKANAI